MKVLFVASEAAPYIKSGGLGDVVGSLPKELQKLGIEVRVIIPNYEAISLDFKNNSTLLQELTVSLGWRQQACRVFQLMDTDFPVYTIDNEYYFKRSNLYGYEDEAERFSFFNKAILEALPLLDFKPDIIHCHDWQTGPLSVLLKAFYSNSPWYKDIKTIFTIHNLHYQGIFPKEILGDILDLDDSYFSSDKLEFFDEVNFIKGGIVYSDLVTTVSRSYAEEIKTAYFGENLEGLLQSKEEKLIGILNGIDYKNYNPWTDKFLWNRFSSNTLGKKKLNKLKLQKELNLTVDEEIPLVAMVSRLVEMKGIDLIRCVIAEMLGLGIQLVILGTGEKHYEDFFRHVADTYPHSVSANITFDEGLSRQIYGGADLYLMPSRKEPCGLSQMIALRYGAIPIVREVGGLRDSVTAFDEVLLTGNGFTFQNYNAHDFLYTLAKGIRIYKEEQEKWSKLMELAMKSDNSWKKSAEEYKRAYMSLNKVE